MSRHPASHDSAAAAVAAGWPGAPPQSWGTVAAAVGAGAAAAGGRWSRLRAGLTRQCGTLVQSGVLPACRRQLPPPRSAGPRRSEPRGDRPSLKIRLSCTAWSPSAVTAARQAPCWICTVIRRSCGNQRPMTIAISVNHGVNEERRHSVIICY